MKNRLNIMVEKSLDYRDPIGLSFEPLNEYKWYINHERFAVDNRVIQFHGHFDIDEHHFDMMEKNEK